MHHDTSHTYSWFSVKSHFFIKNTGHIFLVLVIQRDYVSNCLGPPKQIRVQVATLLLWHGPFLVYYRVITIGFLNFKTILGTWCNSWNTKCQSPKYILPIIKILRSSPCFVCDDISSEFAEGGKNMSGHRQKMDICSQERGDNSNPSIHEIPWNSMNGWIYASIIGKYWSR